MEDVITNDGFLSSFQQVYHKTDVFYVGRIRWRNKFYLPPPADSPFIISGHSDFPITDEIVAKYKFKQWWTVNSQTLRVNGIPLGITNDCDDSPIHRIYGNTAIMKKALDIPRVIQNRVYLNFSVNTHPSRRVVYNMFKYFSWVTVGEQIQTLNGRFKFLQTIRNHEFVLCPRGNGVDTCRLWETLYMGSIPIVQRDIAHRDWEDLPIAWVNSFSEVTPEWLDSQLTRIQEGTWNMEKLKLSYWVKKISESLN
jgi:hypothetical protein